MNSIFNWSLSIKTDLTCYDEELTALWGPYEHLFDPTTAGDRSLVSILKEVFRARHPSYPLSLMVGDVDVEGFLQTITPLDFESVMRPKVPDVRIDPTVKANNHEITCCANLDVKVIQGKPTIVPISHFDPNDWPSFVLTTPEERMVWPSEPADISTVVDSPREAVTASRTRAIEGNLSLTRLHKACVPILSSVKWNKRFDIRLLVYAPPYSGKTTAVSRLKLPMITDTDSNSVGGLMTFTNLPHLIPEAERSIMIVPTKDVFLERCRLRGLEPETHWYHDLLVYSQFATDVVFSNHHVSTILEKMGFPLDTLPP